MARFCTTCGAQLGDTAKFCTSCGAQFPSQPSAAPTPQAQQQFPQQQPVYSQQYQQPFASAPASPLPKKKSKAPLIIVGAVVVIALIAVIAVLGRGKGKDPNTNGGDNGGPGYSQGGDNENGGNNQNNNEANNGGSDGNDSGGAFQYSNDYIANNLKGDYSITYRYSTNSSDGEDDSMTATCVRTSEGYYMNYSGTEMLFIKNGDMYDSYIGDSESGFVKNEFYGQLSKEDVEASMVMGTGLMTQYSTADISGMKKAGSETIAGRKCDKYSYSYSFIGTSASYTYSIDRKTGVCMKYALNAAAGGDSGGMTFECTEFKTSGVSLPNYS